MSDWISKQPPQYFHEKDSWIREPDYSIWLPNIKEQIWIHKDLKIPFLKKTKLLGHHGCTSRCESICNKD